MSKHFITITDENLYTDIVEYCKLNNEKVNNFCQRVLKEQLAIEKYGDTPFGKLIENKVSYKSNLESSYEPEGFEKTPTMSFVDPYIPEYFKKTKEHMDKMEFTNNMSETEETIKPDFNEEKVAKIKEEIKTKKVRRL